MKLHNVIILNSVGSDDITVFRVAGGWIYTASIQGKLSQVFVPFNNEFMEKQKDPLSGR